MPSLRWDRIVGWHCAEIICEDFAFNDYYEYVDEGSMLWLMLEEFLFRESVVDV